MNWLIELGQWWERGRVLRQPDFEKLDSKIELYSKAANVLLQELEKKYDGIRSINDKRFNEIQMNPSIIKEQVLIKARLDRLELITGLKREPVAQQVPGSPRIE